MRTNLRIIKERVRFTLFLAKYGLGRRFKITAEKAEFAENVSSSALSVNSAVNLTLSN